MKTKKYKLFKTWKKTARENNLMTEDHRSGTYKRLFDFSLLDDVVMPECEKEVIKDDAIQNVYAYSKAICYIKTFDNFSACTGNAEFHMQRVFSTDGKLLYVIFTLAKIEHFSQSRKSVYDQKYDTIKYNANDGYVESAVDIEI